MNVKESINRGYNLVITVVLALAAVSLGTNAIHEADLIDKIDDLLFVVIGVIAVVWYNWGRQRFRRTWVPVALAAVALAVQIAWLFVEHDDSVALGDNIGGISLFVPFFIYLLVQWAIDRRSMERLGDSDDATPSPQSAWRR